MNITNTNLHFIVDERLPFVFDGNLKFEDTSVVDHIFVCLVSSCKEAWVVVKCIMDERAESIKQLQQLFHILL